jgi:hypothetical protein
MDTQTALQILERFGLPIFLLCVCGFALYKAAIWAANRIFVPVAERHIKFLDDVSCAVDKITVNQENLVRNMADLSTHVKNHSRRMSSLERVTEETNVN